MIYPDEVIGVEVFLDAADDLGAYQVALEVAGGAAGNLDLMDLFILVTRPDYVYFGVSNYSNDVYGFVKARRAL